MRHDQITITDVDDGLAAELSERIYRFNMEATGIETASGCARGRHA